MGTTTRIKRPLTVSAKQIYFALLIVAILPVTAFLAAARGNDAKARSRSGRFEIAVEKSTLRLTTIPFLAQDPQNRDRIFLTNVERKDLQAFLSWLREDCSLYPSERFQVYATVRAGKELREPDNPARSPLIFQADGKGFIGFEPCMNPQLIVPR